MLNRRILQLAATCMALSCSSFCQQPANTLKKARAELTSFPVIIRGFLQGRKISYTSTGEANDPHPGKWTVDGHLKIMSVEREGRELRIEGERMVAFYDPKAAKMTLQGYKQKVELRIPYDHDSQLEAALQKVFIRAPERLSDNIPAIWRNWAGKWETGALDPRLAPIGKRSENRISGGVHPPTLERKVEPEYTDLAHKLHIEGTAVLVAVVNETGNVEQIEIARPVGAGLDENGIAAVSAWKFKPSTKDGIPVKVKISIEVDFYLN